MLNGIFLPIEDNVKNNRGIANLNIVKQGSPNLATSRI